MPLSKSVIHSRVRSLLNESTQGFYLNTEIDAWIDDAVVDISSKTKCYEVINPVTLTTGIQDYNLPIDTLIVKGAKYGGVGLTRITFSMEGIQTAVATGIPKHFFESVNKIGFVPIPTIAESGTVVNTVIAQVTSNIINLPIKYTTPVILLTTVFGLIKSKQYDKANSLFSLYTNSLGFDLQDNEAEKVKQPQPVSSYILRLMPGNS